MMSTKFLRRYAYAIIVLLVLGTWYGPFLHQVAKPKLVRWEESVPRLQTGVTSAPQSGDAFSYPLLGLAEVPVLNKNLDPRSTQDWKTIGAALRQGVVLTDDTTPDDGITRFLLGHSSDIWPHRYAYVFAGMNSARVGDSFEVRLADVTYNYRVTQKMLVNPTDMDSFAQMEAREQGQDRIIIVTCWPLFTTQQRLVVVGERMET